MLFGNYTDGFRLAVRDAVAIVWAVADDIAPRLGVEVVDVEKASIGRRPVIRLFIDKPEGVSLSDCERMSRELESRLDSAEPEGFPFSLEVSSPGLNRILRKPGDYSRFIGHRIRLLLNRPVEDNWKRYVGLLCHFAEDEITIQTDDGQKRIFPLGNIVRANLEVDWDAKLRERDATRTSGPGRSRSGRGGTRV